MAWMIARPIAVVGIVAMYEEDQVLPLPKMYGKNLTFKTGGVDAANCEDILRLIENITLGTAAVGYRTESMHGAGSPQAQRIMISRQGNLAAKKELAKVIAKVDESKDRK